MKNLNIKLICSLKINQFAFREKLTSGLVQEGFIIRSREIRKSFDSKVYPEVDFYVDIFEETK